jgi:hypothetical protein
MYGDAVNIASRIEPLAEGGGICISEQVYDQVRNKISFPLVKLESPDMKNIVFPIDIYRVRLPWDSQRTKPKGEMGGKAISVIRRDSAKRIRTDSQTMDNFISKLTLKDRIVDVKIISDPSIPQALARFSERVDYGRGRHYTLSLQLRQSWL